MANKRKLGKGLESIISLSPTPVAAIEKAVADDAGRIVELELDSIIPNPDQPRTHFDESAIRELAESIKSIGLIQPITVRRHGEGYAIVAGERRYRAAKSLGMGKINAVVIEANEEKNFTIALIENIQREDLDPVEEARAYRLLIDRFNLKQQDVAGRVGKERATITNSLRLLNLPDDILSGLSGGQISAGHAKVLLSASPETLMRLYEEVIDKGLSVRAREDLVKGEKEVSAEPVQKNGRKQTAKEAHIKKMEEKLRSKLGTKIEIKHSGNKGRIEISYYSLDGFERIVELISTHG
jgi:ParB family chromosome partitioning protein